MEGDEISAPMPLMLRDDYTKIKHAVKVNVLPLLPAKTLTIFSSVSKEWNHWVKSPLLAHWQSYSFKELSGFFCQNELSDPTFVSLNKTAYGVPSPSLDFLPERVDILSSCGGLLACRGRDADELYYICNPANSQWKPLPRPQLYHGLGVSRAILAFEPSARNIEGYYHLICVVPMFDLLYFELYSSETNSWAILNATLLGMEGLDIKHIGFYMKGVAYWLTNTRKVIAVHVEEEAYEVIPIPDECSSEGVLTQIQGELCYISMSFDSGNTYSVWINGGMDLSLKRCLKVRLGVRMEWLQAFHALPCLDGEEVMVLFEGRIYSFGINDGIVREVARGVYADKFVAYVNSLVQLH